MIFRRRADALALRIVAALAAFRWRRVSGRGGAARSDNPLQQPHLYFGGLTARPWWDAAAFPWTSKLEEHADVLRSELRDLLDQGYLKPPPIETIDPKHRDMDQRLVRSGSWHLYRLFYNGFELTENAARCPETTRLFRSIPEQWGTVGFGVLGAGTHISPHCGPSNAKLRIHLGLEIPDGCGIRVGAEARTWTEGRCIIFDDSFEHEVWNRSGRPRYIFLLDVHHPDLTAAEKRWLESTSRTILRLAPRHMKQALLYEPRAEPTPTLKLPR